MKSRTIDIRLIAFYLPQYHPIPENDRWWGKGFTEWHNVVKAQPLFKGHYQPHIPADLGFYDLRLPEVRQAQADLARKHGIYGFCYYHYWFLGRRMLERPFNEVLKSGRPNFPFCLCWANENWMSRWDGREGTTLMEQRYSEDDDIHHIRWLANVFSDHRYIRINNKPLFLVYRASQLPDPKRTSDLWREESLKRGIGEIFLCRVESLYGERGDPRSLGFDAAVEFQPDWKNLASPFLHGRLWKLIANKFLPNRHRVYQYSQFVHTMLQKPLVEYPIYQCVTPSWDNSPRREKGAVIIHESTPAIYEYWLKETINKTSSENNNIVFINAWNEWAEGSHLEPCQKWKDQYLKATKNALLNSNLN